MHVVGDVVRLNGKRFPDRKALMAGDDYLTYADLNCKVNRLAHGLISQGIKVGDRIAIIAPNSLEWMIVHFAIAKIGGIVVPVNFRYKKDELAYVINNCEPSALFFASEAAALVEEAKAEVKKPPLLIAISEEPLNGAPTLMSLMEGMPDAEPQVKVDPNWPFSITYTSGTTGFPKGALAAHSALLHEYFGLVVEGDIREHEIALVNLPFFHVAGTHLLLTPVLTRAGTGVIMPGGFDPEAIGAAVERYGVTLTHWVPTQLAMLLDSGVLDKYDFSSLKKIHYGSSPIPLRVLEESLARINAAFYQFYGQTEILIVSVLPPAQHYGEKSQFTGRALFNCDLRIVDEEERDVRVGEVGEIISYQGDAGMIEYYKNEEATANTIMNGWIHTGDLARLEEDGYFTIVDRIKDMIISGAENVYPKEIENIIGKHPAVSEVAVFGIPDEKWGESVCAAIVRKGGATVDENQIIDFCASRLSSYKKPKQVIFLDELPRNATGKVTKNLLREPFWAGRKKRI